MFLRAMIMVFLASTLFLQGCETAKGFKKDTLGLWEKISKADDWVKEKFW